MPTPAPLTLLTDFGLTDYYVGAVKGTILRLAPETTVLVDLSHDVAPGDVAGAGFLLAAAAPAFPRGTVHLSVIDPGVGSERRILAVAASGQLFVAPDNGLLTRILEWGENEDDDGHGSVQVHAVTREDLFLDAPGHTFHGRDRFAPVAAALLRGEPLAELGPSVDDPMRLETVAPMKDGHKLVGHVVHIDRFGNLVTDIPAGWLPHGESFKALFGTHSTELRVDRYTQLPKGQAGVLTGSLGTLELSFNGESLSERWRVERGQRVLLRLAREAPNPDPKQNQLE